MLRGRFHQIKVFNSSTRPSIMVLFHFWLSQYAKLLLNSSWYHFKKVSFFTIIFFFPNSLGSVKEKEKNRQNDFQCKIQRAHSCMLFSRNFFFLSNHLLLFCFLLYLNHTTIWRKNWHHISFHNFVAGSYCYFF